MRLLRILHLAVIAARRVGDVVLTVELGRLCTSGRDSRFGQRRGVGAHVGDVAALIQSLGHAHCSLGIPAEPTRRLLLQRGCHEGRLGTALAGLFHHGADGVVRSLECRGKCSGCGLVQDDTVPAGQLSAIIEVTSVGEPLALHEIEPRCEGTGIEGGGEVPIGGGDEGDALALSIDDQTYGH